MDVVLMLRLLMLAGLAFIVVIAASLGTLASVLVERRRARTIRGDAGQRPPSGRACDRAAVPRDLAVRGVRAAGAAGRR
jgi:hypothetical protein